LQAFSLASNCRVWQQVVAESSVDRRIAPGAR
jgi:hypothetical protein